MACLEAGREGRIWKPGAIGAQDEAGAGRDWRTWRAEKNCLGYGEGRRRNEWTAALASVFREAGGYWPLFSDSSAG